MSADLRTLALARFMIPNFRPTRLVLLLCFPILYLNSTNHLRSQDVPPKRKCEWIKSSFSQLARTCPNVTVSAKVVVVAPGRSQLHGPFKWKVESQNSHFFSTQTVPFPTGKKMISHWKKRTTSAGDRPLQGQVSEDSFLRRKETRGRYSSSLVLFRPI